MNLVCRCGQAAGWALAAGTAGWGLRHARSPAVVGWRAGTGRSSRAGPLQVRTFGSGTPVVVLLHGMAASGNCFGAAFDPLGRAARVVVPDLLGFGASPAAPGPVTGADHLAALEAMLLALGLADASLVVVGHSMGGGLALRLAARRGARARAVITLCAALYRDRTEADMRIASMGRVEALLAGDGTLPHLVCGWMCRHRAAAGWVAVATRPDLPVPVARCAVKHTWDSYRGALQGLLRDPAWEPALHRLAATEVPVVLADGGRDPVPVPGRAAGFAAAATVQHQILPGAGHLMPLSDGGWCADLLARWLNHTGPTG